MKQALYRKYRPNTFDQVLGQENDEAHMITNEGFNALLKNYGRTTQAFNFHISDNRNKKNTRYYFI
ncbi:hypothetical protein ABGF48_08240 [Helcococcus bovis]|uniref:hypothetical protein n=1 Tax=Helcococcus bovis TaxID=3153252 RepID=UPI0038BE0B66